jgi:hypothetical protein
MYNNLQLIVDNILGIPPVGYEFINYIVSVVLFFFVFRILFSPFAWIMNKFTGKD